MKSAILYKNEKNTLIWPPNGNHISASPYLVTDDGII